jgi:hypothetical protein
MTRLNAIILMGRFKTSSEISHTDLLSQCLAKHLITYGVGNEIVRLADYDIRPGVYTKVDSDGWP